MSATLLALLCSGVTGGLMAWLGVSSPKRLQRLRAAITTPVGLRRLVLAAALLPALPLIAFGWWSALLIWLGGSLVIGWAVALWLSGAEPAETAGSH